MLPCAHDCVFVWCCKKIYLSHNTIAICWCGLHINWYNAQTFIITKQISKPWISASMMSDSNITQTSKSYLYQNQYHNNMKFERRKPLSFCLFYNTVTFWHCFLCHNIRHQLRSSIVVFFWPIQATYLFPNMLTCGTLLNISWLPFWSRLKDRLVGSAGDTFVTKWSMYGTGGSRFEMKGDTFSNGRGIFGAGEDVVAAVIVVGHFTTFSGFPTMSGPAVWVFLCFLPFFLPQTLKIYIGIMYLPPPSIH